MLTFFLHKSASQLCFMIEGKVVYIVYRTESACFFILCTKNDTLYPCIDDCPCTHGTRLKGNVKRAFVKPPPFFIGASVVMLIFVNIFGRFPQKSAKDISCFAVFFLFIMFDRVFCFGSVFYWAAGCFNYLWAWFFILIVITPINLFWRKIEFSKKQTIAITMLSIPIGIVAGWSSEFGIVFIVLWIASIIFAKIKKIKLFSRY